MQINKMREHSHQLSQPITKREMNQNSFIRCLDSTDQDGRLAMGSVYLVRDVVDVADHDRGRISQLYKLDGFEGGVKSEKLYRANQFQRWIPSVGDVVLRGNNQNPLLVSRIDLDHGVNSGAADKLHLHSYSADHKRWSYMDTDRGMDIRPALGVSVDPEVVEMLHGISNVLNAVLPDESFVPPTITAINPEEDLGLLTAGDKAREHRISSLRKDYMAALEKVIYLNDQYVVQMGQPLPGGQEIRRIGEGLKIVRPPIKR